MEAGDFTSAAKVINSDYYDPLYRHTLNEVKVDFELNTDDLDEALKVLQAKF